VKNGSEAGTFPDFSMKNKTHTGLGILLMALCTLPRAARASGPTPLTIGQAIEQALQSNLSLLQANEQVELHRIERDRSRATFYPTVGASIGTSGTLGGRSSSDNLAGSLSASVGSGINLFNGYADRAALGESELNLKAAGGDRKRQRQQVVFETISRFAEAITTGEFIQVGREHLDAQRRALDLIEEFQRAGKRPIADVYQQQAEVASAELALLNAERDHRVSKLNLLKTLGRAPQERVEVVAFDVDKLIAGLPEDPAIGEALERPDLEAQRDRVDAAARHVEVARGGYWPSLDLTLNAATSYTTGVTGGFGDQLFGDSLNATLGLSLTIPIFDRTLTARDVEQSRVLQENQWLVLEELGQQAGVELLQALEDYRTAHKRLAVTASQLKSARQTLSALEERYRVNAATLSELSLARARQLDASYQHVKARYDLLLRAVAVRYYQGDLDGMIGLVSGRNIP